MSTAKKRVKDTEDLTVKKDNPTPSHYNFHYKGVKIDPYRILHEYGITHPAHQHVIKRLLRAGKSVKSLEKDIDESIDALNRWKEMIKEEKEQEITIKY